MKLYIIGNGFDISHNLKTSYLHFGEYLKSFNADLYNMLLEHFGFPEITQVEGSDTLWSEFESNLTLLDIENILEAFEDYLPNYSSDSFRSRDYHSFAFEMERALETLTCELTEALRKFIISLSYDDNPGRLKIDNDSYFISFNYTDTLETYYAIDEEQILYIHGKAKEQEAPLIFGHGIDPENFKEDPIEPPANLSDHELCLWEQDQSDKFDYSYEEGKSIIYQYFLHSFKNTQEIINESPDFFNIYPIPDEVIIIGHSLGEVDLPYFKELAKKYPNIPWTVSYYEEIDKKHFEKAIKNLEIHEFKVMHIDNFKINNGDLLYSS